MATTYEASLLAELLDRYALEKVLTGTKEDVLGALLGGSKTISELQWIKAKAHGCSRVDEADETGTNRRAALVFGTERLS